MAVYRMIGGEVEQWPGDHIIEPLVAATLSERFAVDGGRDPSVEWLPSAARL
jgi:hypothetical protein